MPRSCPGQRIARLVGHHADIARRNQGRVVRLALDPRAGLGAGVHIHDLDIKAVCVDPITPRRQDLAEDAAKSLVVDQVGALGERLADLGDQDADLAGRNDLVLDELGLVLQGRVKMASGAGHGLEDADLERAAGAGGLHQGSLRRLGPRAKRPGALVADEQAVSRGNLDAADHPLPDADVTDQEEEDDGQEGLGHRAEGLSSNAIHGWFSSEVSTGDRVGWDDDGLSRLAAGAAAVAGATSGRRAERTGDRLGRRQRPRLVGPLGELAEQIHERTFRVAEDRAERRSDLAQQHVPGHGRAVAVERRDLGGQAGRLGRVVKLDHVGLGLGLGEDGRSLVLGGLELGLGDLELLLGQRHGHLLLLLGLGRLLDDLLLGLDHALLLLGQHDLDLQFRLGELLELLAPELRELLLGDLPLLHRLGDVAREAGSR